MPGPIVACILSRDESELLRENIAHLIKHEGVSHIIVTNHVSIEANKKVLSEFGSNIVAQFDEPRPLPFPQDVWRTRMVRHAIRRCKASWLVCTDTDEFWYNLRELHDVPRNYNSVQIMQLHDHFGTRLDPTKGYSVYNMPWYWFSPGRRFGKTIHRAVSPKMSITHRSHRPVQRGGVIKNFGNIHLHHYLVRDWERFLLKVNTANENNQAGCRRTTWRQLQKLGMLRTHWQERYMPPREEIEKRIQKSEAGFFMPEPI